MHAAIQLGLRLLLLGAIATTSLLALDPTLEINQYSHVAWRVRDGFSQGMTFAIAQTPDGYLWLGTEFGLVRFDGVRPVSWDFSSGEKLPSRNIWSLAAARDGTLWIGTTRGLASWNHGNLSNYPELNGVSISGILEDRQGVIWIAGRNVPIGKLCAIRNHKFECAEEKAFGVGPSTLLEDRKGALWAVTDTGLWRWNPGPPRFYPVPGSRGIGEDDNGELLVGDGAGIRRFIDGNLYPVAKSVAGVGYRKMLRDRDGGIWIPTHEGIAHLHQGKREVFTESSGLSGNDVFDVFEDREGNIWVASNGGVDRFRDITVASYSKTHGLSGVRVGPVLAVKDGSVWIGTDSGLNRWSKGRIATFAQFQGADIHSLFQDRQDRVWISSSRGLAYWAEDRFTAVSGPSGGTTRHIGEDATGLWLVNNAALLHYVERSFANQIPLQELGAVHFASALAADPSQTGLWVGFDLGIVHIIDGNPQPAFTSSQGPQTGRVSHLRIGADGALWASTERGLSRIKEGRIATLRSSNGLPCDAIHWSIEDDNRALWLLSACGLLHIERSEWNAWTAAADQGRSFGRKIRAAAFDPTDGVILHSGESSYGPAVSKSSDGKLWYSSIEAVSVLDPSRIPFNKLAPPVHIEKITADRTIQWQNLGIASASTLRLPALSRDLQIDYTALSFVAPEKIRFKYRLEGHDRDWQDAGNRRQAFYNDLPPRNYRFRVIASNNSGVWNETGDTLEFSIAPAYYQTTWFYASCVAAFLAAIWGLYRLRLHQIARELNAQLDGRVDERLRVARDLHDTMLQTFQAALIQMQAGYNVLSHRPEKAAEAIQKAITTSAGAIAEGREAIQNMRSSTITQNDLARALRLAGDQMASEGSATFDIRVQGSSRDLHPILRDEVYLIALEAMRNAFTHAEAHAIEAEIVYGDSLRVRIRDDGKGIDPVIMEQGRRSGHYGLPGMHERAERIGGKLDVWTGPGAGTEIQLSIPGTIAFGRSGGGSLLRRFRRKGKSDAAAQS